MFCGAKIRKYLWFSNDLQKIKWFAAHLEVFWQGFGKRRKECTHPWGASFHTCATTDATCGISHLLTTYGNGLCGAKLYAHTTMATCFGRCGGIGFHRVCLLLPGVFLNKKAEGLQRSFGCLQTGHIVGNVDVPSLLVSILEFVGNLFTELFPSSFLKKVCRVIVFLYKA